MADIPPDDYTWRKYGQKPIKGSPHPRYLKLISLHRWIEIWYYNLSSLNCNLIIWTGFVFDNQGLLQVQQREGLPGAQARGEGAGRSGDADRHLRGRSQPHPVRHAGDRGPRPRIILTVCFLTFHRDDQIIRRLEIEIGKSWKETAVCDKKRKRGGEYGRSSGQRCWLGLCLRGNYWVVRQLA